MTTGKWQIAICAAIFSVLILSQAACGGAKEAAIMVPEGAQAGDLVGMDACIYEVDDLEYEAECGTLIVPENREVPGSQLIGLPIIKVLATGTLSAEPIFWLAGGPGGTNMNFTHLDGLVDNHDIVMVGYRGVDGSVVLDCPEVTKAWRGTGGDLFSDESLRNIGESFRLCAEEWRAKGVDLDGYNLPGVVEDLEDARVALNYPWVNLLSGSYGTRVAMFYAALYPESVYRSVMTAVNTPGHFVWEPETLDEQIEYDASLCAQDSGCSARTDDLAETMRNVTDNMPDRWLFIRINPGKVRVLTHFLLYHRRSSATVYDLYLAAEEGDPSGLALMSVMYDLIWPGMITWGEWASKGIIDYDPNRDWVAAMDPPDSIIGSPVSLVSGGSGKFGDSWPQISVPEVFLEPPASDVETLMVSGSIDFSVAPQWATDELLPLLPNGHQVILSEFGHTSDFWGLQPEATVHLLTTFYDQGVVDDSHYTYQPMDFQVDWGWPTQAKQYLAIAIGGPLLLILLIWFIVWLIRRLRARKSTKQSVQ
jgi:pimeloyl-ACP methyl ester carboxylesterase